MKDSTLYCLDVDPGRAVARGGGRPIERLVVALLSLLVFSIPFENGMQIPGVGSIARILGLAAFGVGVLALFERGRFHFRMPSVFTVLALLFALYSLATYFWSAFPGESFSTGATYGQLFVMAWLIWQFTRSDGQAASLMQWFVLGNYLSIAIAISVFFTSGDRSFRDVGDAFNANEFSIVAALAIPFAWYLYLRGGNRLLGLLNLLYPAFAILGLLLSASRGGLLTTLVALAVIPFSLRRLGFTRQVLLFSVIGLTTWVGFVQAPRLFPQLERSIERLSSTSTELSGGDLTGRTVIWEHGVDAFLDRPAFGHGTGTFAYVIESELGDFKEAHNAFLSVAVGGGLTGLVIYASMIAIVFLTIIGTGRDRRLFLVILFGAMLVGMMPSNAEDSKHVWFVLALLASQNPVVFSVASQRPSSRTRNSTAIMEPR